MTVDQTLPLYTFRPIKEMRPVRQTAKGGGTCLMACLATLMRIEHDDVFDLYEPSERGEDYWAPLTEWCHSRGYALYWVPVGDTDKWPLPDGYYIESWQWEGDLDWHVVVARDGRVVHDPDGGRQKPGLVRGYFILEPLR